MLASRPALRIFTAGSSVRWERSVVRRILAATLVASGLAACGQGVTGCAVGVRGSAAVIEISGPGAGVVCARMISQDGATYFATDPQESKPIVCVVPVGTLKYTVRDQGMLLLQGNAVCNSLTITPEAPAPIAPTEEIVEYPTARPYPTELWIVQMTQASE